MGKRTVTDVLGLKHYNLELKLRGHKPTTILILDELRAKEGNIDIIRGVHKPSEIKELITITDRGEADKLAKAYVIPDKLKDDLVNKSTEVVNSILNELYSKNIKSYPITFNSSYSALDENMISPQGKTVFYHSVVCLGEYIIDPFYSDVAILVEDYSNIIKDINNGDIRLNHYLSYVYAAGGRTKIVKNVEDLRYL